MRIAFDCSTIKPGRAGIANYAEHLLREIASLLGPDDRVWTVTPYEPPPGLPSAPRMGPSQNIGLWMHVAVPRLARRFPVDLFHFTANTAPLSLSVPYVVTIHDMSPIRMPEAHPFSRTLYYRATQRWTSRRARWILTDSEASGRDIVELLGVPPERVTVVPLAPHERFRRVADEALEQVRQRYGLREAFALFVGSLEPRKNLARLLEAFARTRTPGLTLAVVGGTLRGGMEGLLATVRALNLETRVRFLGYVPDEDLPALYSAAEFFVYPSLFEGFGLPVVEAFACGTPVITSRASSLVEVAEGAALLVDPLSIDDIAAAIESLAADSSERERLSRLGLVQAERYSWTEAARRTIDVYRKALEL